MLKYNDLPIFAGGVLRFFVGVACVPREIGTSLRTKSAQTDRYGVRDCKNDGDGCEFITKNEH